MPYPGAELGPLHEAEWTQSSSALLRGTVCQSGIHMPDPPDEISRQLVLLKDGIRQPDHALRYWGGRTLCSTTTASENPVKHSPYRTYTDFTYCTRLGHGLTCLDLFPIHISEQPRVRDFCLLYPDSVANGASRYSSTRSKVRRYVLPIVTTRARTHSRAYQHKRYGSAPVVLYIRSHSRGFSTAKEDKMQ